MHDFVPIKSIPFLISKAYTIKIGILNKDKLN